MTFNVESRSLEAPGWGVSTAVRTSPKHQPQMGLFFDAQLLQAAAKAVVTPTRSRNQQAPKVGHALRGVSGHGCWLPRFPQSRWPGSSSHGRPKMPPSGALLVLLLLLFHQSWVAIDWAPGATEWLVAKGAAGQAERAHRRQASGGRLA